METLALAERLKMCIRDRHKTAANDFEAASQVLTAGLDVEASSYSYTVLADKIRNGEFDISYINQAVKLSLIHI